MPLTAKCFLQVQIPVLVQSDKFVEFFFETGKKNSLFRLVPCPIFRNTLVHLSFSGTGGFVQSSFCFPNTSSPGGMHWFGAGSL